MHWRKRNAWKMGIAVTATLLLLLVMVWIPVSVAGAHEEALGQARLGMITVQATPTEDATVTVLNKEFLTQQVAQQQHTWDNWLWGNAATILSSFLSTLVIVIGALFGFWQWRVGRKDTLAKEADARQKELKDRQDGREKQTEERFQAAVTGLGDQKEEVRVGATVLLRTFLGPDHEQFYTRVFDLAVAHLRLTNVVHASEDVTTPLPLTTLRWGLIDLFKGAVQHFRREKQENQEFLDATGIRLDNAYLQEADLRRVWMPMVSLRGADLRWANLSEANLQHADLSTAILVKTDLSGADLFSAHTNYPTMAFFLETNFSGARLCFAHLSGEFQGSDFSGANLSQANLEGCYLGGTNLEHALSLEKTNLCGAKGLTTEQLAACKAKGAIIDEDPATNPSQSTIATSSPSQSDDVQASSISLAQGSLPTPDADGSSATSSTNL